MLKEIKRQVANMHKGQNHEVSTVVPGMCGYCDFRRKKLQYYCRTCCARFCCMPQCVQDHANGVAPKRTTKTFTIKNICFKAQPNKSHSKGPPASPVRGGGRGGRR